MTAGTADALQAEVARLALASAQRHGFALAGGRALIAHGVVDRPTEDVDLFTDEENGVQAAAELITAALRGAGLVVEEIAEPGDLSDTFYGFERDLAEYEIRRESQAAA